MHNISASFYFDNCVLHAFLTEVGKKYIKSTMRQNVPSGHFEKTYDNIIIRFPTCNAHDDVTLHNCLNILFDTPHQ